MYQSLLKHDDPAVWVIARRAVALNQQAKYHNSDASRELFGEEAAKRMALGFRTASRQMWALAKEVADNGLEGTAGEALGDTPPAA
jgi:hypothetical protein